MSVTNNDLSQFAFTISTSYNPGEPLCMSFAFVCPFCGHIHNNIDDAMLSAIGPRFALDATTNDRTADLEATCVQCEKVVKTQLLFKPMAGDSATTEDAQP